MPAGAEAPRGLAFARVLLLAAPSAACLAWAPFFSDPEGLVALKACVAFLVLCCAGFLAAGPAAPGTGRAPARAEAPFVRAPLASLLPMLAAFAGLGALYLTSIRRGPDAGAHVLALGCGAVSLAAAAVLFDRTCAHRLPLAVLAAAFAIAALVLAQELGLFRGLALPDAAQPAATLGNRNMAATVLAAGFAIAVAWIGAPRGGVSRGVRWATLGALALALAATRTEGAVGGAAAGALFAIGSSTRSRILRIAGLTGVIAVAVAGVALTLAFAFAGPRTLATLPEAIRSRPDVLERAALWTVAGHRLRERPLAPAGPAGFARVRERGEARFAGEPAWDGVVFVSPHAHNDVLEYAVEGTPLLPLAVLLAGSLLLRGAHRRHQDPRTSSRERFALVGSCAGLVAVGVHALGHFPLHLPENLVIAGALAGAMLAQSRESTSARGVPAGPGAAGRLALAGLASLPAALPALAPHVFFETGHRAAAREDLRGAEAGFERAVRHSPSWSLAWENLAAARAARGDLPGADAAALRATQTDPDSASAWTSLGAVRGRRGDLDGAEEAFRRALERNPRYLPAAEGLEAVRRARGTGFERVPAPR